MSLSCFKILLKNLSLAVIYSIFIAINSFATSEVINYTTNTTDTVGSYTTNYANVIGSKTVQVAESLGSSLESAFPGFAHGKIYFVNPFKPNPFKPKFSRCIHREWEISKPSNTNAFMPLIKVKVDIVIACVGYRGTVTLHSFGQCSFLGLIRVCARNTPPCKYGNNRCCSGDTKCNQEVSTCPGCKSNSAYRACVFEDPMFPIDPTDINANSMPFQEKTKVPPSIPSGNSLIALGALISIIGIMVPGLGAFALAAGVGLLIAGGIMNLLRFISSTINYVVMGNRGCVDIPLTPYPPPFCSPLGEYIPEAQVMTICQNSPEFALSQEQISSLQSLGYTQAEIDEINNKQVSSTDNPCEIAKGSKIYSTYENPVVRLYFSNPLPVCPSGYQIPEVGTMTPGNDTCVLVQNLDTPYNIWFNDLNLLPLCSSSRTSNCLIFPSGRTWGAPFRPYYNYVNGTTIGLSAESASSPTPFAVLPTVVDSLKSVAPSLVFAGINDSKYLDATPGSLVKITDFTGVQRSFLVTFDTIGANVCVYERILSNCGDNCSSLNTLSTDLPVSCAPRPAMLNKPTLTACTTSNTSTCSYVGSSDPKIFTEPRVIVSIGTSPATPRTGVLGVDLDVSNDDGSFGTGNYPATAPPTPFCASDDVTQSSNKTPGNSTDNPSPCSIYGAQLYSTYLTDIYNQTSQKASTITPTYPASNLTVQYSNGLYCRGATKICLTGYTDNSKQVVARIISYVDDVGITQTSVSEDLRDRIIPPYVAGQTEISTFFNSSNYWTSNASVERIVIGTQDPKTGAYYENESCTSAENVSCVPNGTPTVGTPVGTVCTCTNVSVTPNTTSTCTISGCDKAFVTSTTNAAVEIGGRDPVSLQYFSNPACVTSTVICTATEPTNGQTITYPTSATCQCLVSGSWKACGSSTPENCNWAFQPSSSSTISEALGFTYNGTNYALNDSNGNPQYGLRNANSLEIGLCTNIVQPTCASINHASTNETGTGTDGYANWSTTSLNNQATGTCLSGMKYETTPPTRYCTYIDNGYEQIQLEDESIVNGCPKYTIGFTAVSNPCTPIVPAWWPSEFLYNNTNFQGAIINQFNISPNYMGKVVPNANNYPQISGSINSWSTTSPETWITQGYNGCKRYGYNIDLNRVPRTVSNGDQEMLFITRDNWRAIWEENKFTIPWVLNTASNTNGCYVYNVNNKFNGTVNSGVIVGLKICKYNSKISFSLVDLGADSSTSYTNTSYIMQSNIIAYDALTTRYVTQISVNGGGITEKTYLENGLYQHPINHGIVIDKTGFAASSVVPVSPPSDFVPIATPESIITDYKFLGLYKYNTSSRRDGDYFRFTYYNNGSITVLGEDDQFWISSAPFNSFSCALSAYRGSVSYPVSSGVSYYAIPSVKSSSSVFNNYNYAGLYISSLYTFTGYGGDHKQNVWPNENHCSMYIRVGNLVKGNSAANTNMFLWSSPTLYNVCNN